MDRAIAREQSLSRLLMTYIITGLIFMLLPGTFLGVWNLIKISSREAVNSVSPAWIQAHGHAQLFGWVGTFILGIGFYSIPKLRKLKPFALREGWLCLGLWVVGVTSRWFANVYPWHWRVLLPLSAALELLAFLIFFRAVASHRPATGTPKPWEPWIFVVVAATMGLLTSLMLNLGASIQLARNAASPAFSHEFDQRYLIVSTWGFLVPMVWGFSSRWLPVHLPASADGRHHAVKHDNRVVNTKGDDHEDISRHRQPGRNPTGIRLWPARWHHDESYAGRQGRPAVS
jgi:hypothetical protein